MFSQVIYLTLFFQNYDYIFTQRWQPWDISNCKSSKAFDPTCNEFFCLRTNCNANEKGQQFCKGPANFADVLMHLIQSPTYIQDWGLILRCYIDFYRDQITGTKTILKPEYNVSQTDDNDDSKRLVKVRFYGKSRRPLTSFADVGNHTGFVKKFNLNIGSNFFHKPKSNGIVFGIIEHHNYFNRHESTLFYYQISWSITAKSGIQRVVPQTLTTQQVRQPSFETIRIGPFGKEELLDKELVEFALPDYLQTNINQILEMQIGLVSYDPKTDEFRPAKIHKIVMMIFFEICIERRQISTTESEWHAEDCRPIITPEFVNRTPILKHSCKCSSRKRSAAQLDDKKDKDDDKSSRYAIIFTVSTLVIIVLCTIVLVIVFVSQYPKIGQPV